MQAQPRDGSSANQMENNSHLSQSSYPVGFGGLHERGFETFTFGLPQGPSESSGAFCTLPTNASPPNNVLYDLSQPVTGQFPFGASQIAAAQGQGPVYGGNFVQGDEFTNSSHEFSTQLPQYVSGQNALVPPQNYGLNVPSAAGSQMGNFLMGTPSTGFQQPVPQWARINDMVQMPPNMANYGDFEDTFCSGMDMGDMTMNAPFLPNAGAVGDNADWAGMEYLDSMMTDSPMIPGPAAADANSLQQAVPSIPQAPPASTQAPGPRVTCTHCPQTFVRDYDRIRHESSKHNNGPAAHLCPVNGCPKNQGRGYTRADKLTEHMWKKHAALGYAKRV